MPYTPTTFVNNQAPAITASQLNKLGTQHAEAVGDVEDQITSGTGAIGTAIKDTTTVKNAAGIYSADYVQVGDTNDTSELQAMIADIAAGRARGGLAPRIYTASNLVLPEYSGLVGWGAGMTRFPTDPANQYRYGAVVIKRPAGNTDPVVTIAGGGAILEGVTLDGNGSAGPILVTKGFESQINNVRMINNQDIGFDVQRANNTRWSNIYVDDCGSSTQPAVRIWSPPLGTGYSNESNTVDIVGLTIERSHNDVSLEVAYGTTSSYWAEWVRITNLHVESSYLDHANTVLPQIAIGNTRGVTLIDPFIYGGPALLLRQNQQVFRSYGNGGLKILGGTFNGSDANNTTATPTLIELQNGDEFSAIGTRFMRYSVRAVAALSTYGTHVNLDSSCSFYGPGTTQFTDQRTSKAAIPLRSDVTVGGHLNSGRTNTPAISVSSGIGTPTLLPATGDMAGKVTFTTTASPPAAGLLFTITFDKPYTREPAVPQPGAGTAATANLGLYYSASTTELKVYAANAPAANTNYQISYGPIAGLEVA